MVTKLLLFLLLSFSAFAETGVKISELPLLGPSAVGTSDSFPFVSVSNNMTGRMNISSLLSVPSLSTALTNAINGNFPTCTSGQLLAWNTTGFTSCYTPSAGSGTVTSVGLSVPSWLSVAGSPVTSSGTLAVTATTGQTANQFLASPNGSTGAIGLRSIVGADLPNPSASTLGGVQSKASVLHNFLTSISTSGVPAAAQPACADLSNGAASCSVDATNAANITTGILVGAQGGTNNGFMQFSGPGTSLKTYTLPNVSSNILTDNAAVTVPQGGTGLTSTTAYAPIAGGTTSTAALQSLGTGMSNSGWVLTSNGTAAVPTWQAPTGGSGVNTVGTFSGSSQTNGASIASTTITFGPADGTNPGMVTTGSQTLAGAKTFSGAPTFSAGGTFTLSGGTNTFIQRSGKAGLKIMDADTYLSVPGFDFLAGASGTTLLGEWDASQFIIQTPMNFFPDATYSIGGTYRPTTITSSGTITSGGFFVGSLGMIITGITRTTSTSNQAIGANTFGIILDPASPTATQTVTLPTSGNSANGELLHVICGAQGVTSLTFAAGSGTSISVGTNPIACVGRGFQFYYLSATTTWYQM